MQPRKLHSGIMFYIDQYRLILDFAAHRFSVHNVMTKCYVLFQECLYPTSQQHC